MPTDEAGRDATMGYTTKGVWLVEEYHRRTGHYRTVGVFTSKEEAARQAKGLADRDAAAEFSYNVDLYAVRGEYVAN